MDNGWMEDRWTDETDSEREGERERERRARRLQKRAEMRRRKRRQRQIRRIIRLFMPLAGIICIILLVTGMGKAFRGKEKPVDLPNKSLAEEAGNGIQNETFSSGMEKNGGSEGADQKTSYNKTSDNKTSDNKTPDNAAYEAIATADTAYLSDLFSTNAVLIEVETGTILAQKDAKTIINPASMTKILTILVAAEHVTNLDDTLTITQDMIDYCFVNDCSNVGFELGETVTVRDLFYGTVLPSGADAAIGLAAYVAGSHEAFVDMMNDKLEELGLSETAHFTNAVGVYDERHYCTVYDMAMIMKAAIDNELCREVLSTRIYTTKATKEHPEGIEMSNWFIRRIEDKDAGGRVLGGKTGYVVQSGSCAASFGTDKSGREFICVTGNANSQWRCIEDHAKIYKRFMLAD